MREEGGGCRIEEERPAASLPECAVARFPDRRVERSSPAAVEALEALILVEPDAEVVRRACVPGACGRAA